MPRGYGGAYRINPRPIYGENEPTWGESMGRGISRFLADKAQQQQETEDWQNQVRDAGGEIVAPPSTMDRLRGIAGAIRRHLPGYDPLPEAQASLDARGGPQVGTTPNYGDDQGMNVRSYSPPVVHDGKVKMEPRIDTTAPIMSGGAHGYRGDAGEGDSRYQYGITQEIDRSIQKGPGGYEAILPTALGRQQMATRAEMMKQARERAGKRADFAYEKGIEHAGKMEEIAATPHGGLTPEEWDRRESIREADAAKLKGTPTGNAPDQTTAKRRQRISELRATILSAQGVIPKNAFDRKVAVRDPEQKRRIEQAERDRDAAQAELNRIALPEDQAGPGKEELSKRAKELAAEARQQYPKASAQAIRAYVYNHMKAEGLPVK